MPFDIGQIWNLFRVLPLGLRRFQGQECHRIEAIQNSYAPVFVLVAMLVHGPLYAALSSTNAGPGFFFVATNGNDAWSGCRPAANFSKTDGPFASVQRALQAARDYRKQVGGSSNAPAGIFLRGGLYTFSEPLVLKPEDSNLVLAAYGTETPVLSGGRRITGWQPVAVRGKNMWAVELPYVRQGKWSFHELWVNSQRAVLARYPSQGYLKVADVPDKSTDGFKGVRRFKFNSGELKVSPNLTNAEVVVMSLWIDSHLPVSSVDEVGQMINCSRQSKIRPAPGDFYYLEGSVDFMQQPGEWCLDQPSGVLYYLPRPGETLKSVEAVAPVLTQVLRLEGRPETAELVERVRLRHLTFSHTEWYFPTGVKDVKPFPGPDPPADPQVGGLGQGAYQLPAALYGRGLRRCFLRDCSFVHVGNYALDWRIVVKAI